jgi:tRNA-dihydrouridine synthase B
VGSLTSNSVKSNHDSNARLIRPLRIGQVGITTNLILSPMSGVTDSAFRRMVRGCSGDAVGLVVSEFIASEGLTRDNAKTFRMLRYLESERPVSIQIFGADVDRMVRAAVMVEEVGADVVDINCGCPAPKVVRRGGGAQLMRDPETLAQVVRETVRAVAIPVTVKIRSGWDDPSRNALDVARRVEDAGAAMLAVHGRTRVQLYSGSADWELVAEIRDALAIPVIGSGDVVDARSAIARLVSRAADGVMIGRAAMSNPWIFAQTVALANGLPPVVPTSGELVRALESFRDALSETLPETAFIGRYRGLACHFVKGMRSSAAARAAIGRSRSIAEVTGEFTDFVMRGEDEVPLIMAPGGEAFVAMSEPR